MSDRTDIRIVPADQPCVIHGERHWVTVPAEGYRRWRRGDLPIQAPECLGMLSIDKREVLITGTCTEAWDAITTDLEEESDDIEPCCPSFEVRAGRQGAIIEVHSFDCKETGR